MVRLHPHARERMEERGATEEEVRATVELVSSNMREAFVFSSWQRTVRGASFRPDAKDTINLDELYCCRCLSGLLCERRRRLGTLNAG